MDINKNLKKEDPAAGKVKQFAKIATVVGIGLFEERVYIQPLLSE